MKSICVVGGGNSGLMSALLVKKLLPNLSITLIKSKNIGTIGVGEGSTEHWTVFAQAAGISIFDLMNECGATIKIGIKFENWHGDGTSYFHSIFDSLATMESYTGAAITMMRLISEGIAGEDMYWKLPMKGYVREPLSDYSQFHFDSEKLNEFLQERCIQAGINIYDSEIVDVKLDNEGFIESISDKEGKTYSADFFIDSSGFRRVLSSKLGAEWVDWSKHLPMNSAIAFQTPYEEKLPPYTLARAMNSGWSWRSPVQERFGNGYVFSDNFITEEQALDEIQQYYKDTVNIGRKINFKSGKVNKAWIKNCLSIGLSSNFVEPLEASSIASTVKQLQLFIGSIYNWSKEDTGTIKKYNEIFDDMMLNVLDFIQLHYFTKRDDTDFWRWCKHEITMTDFNKEHLEIFKKNFVNQIVLPEDGIMRNFRIYDCLNWIQVMHGLRMFDSKKIKEIYEIHFSQFRTQDEYALSLMPTEPGEGWLTCREAVNLVKNFNSKNLEHKL
jgi:tryptophan halogenase